MEEVTVCQIALKLETDSYCGGGNVAEEVCNGARRLETLARLDSYGMQ